jgi:hypothetical protein
MKRWMISLGAALLLALPTLVAFYSPADAQDAAGAGRCLNKREIQQQIDSGRLRQLSEAMARANVDGKIISDAKVCRDRGQLMWEINIMDNYGASKQVRLPAE